MLETIDYWHLREREVPNFNNLLSKELWDNLVINPREISFKKIDGQDKIKVIRNGCYITTITSVQYESLQKNIF